MTVPHELRADQLSLGYDAAPVVTDLDLRIPPEQVTVIVGANGCGKSTLLRGMARLLQPVSGQVLLDGQSVHTRPARQVAQLLGSFRTSPAPPWPPPLRTLSAHDPSPPR